MGKISIAVEKVLGMLTDIGNAAEEQSNSSTYIKGNILKITTLLDNTSNITKESAVGAEHAKIIAENLKILMDKFKV